MTRTQDENGTTRHCISALIPTTWTGEQANAVVVFLEEIVSAIWYAHENNILDFLEGRLPTTSTDFVEDINVHPIDEDIPF